MSAPRPGVRSPDPGRHAELVAERNSETVRTFLRLLEEGDIDTWIMLWAEDAFQFYPFGTEMFPSRIRGRHAVHERWKALPQNFTTLRFPLRDLWATGDTVVARFDGDCVLASGEPYANSYMGLFVFTPEGRVHEYWEYFDPIVAGQAFGLVDVHYRTEPGTGSS